MSFSALKKRKNNLDALKEKAKQSSGKSGGSYNDDRYWNLERDKAGNGYAIIRFLDVSKADQEHYGDDADIVPWAHYYTHQFKNEQGRWFVANCLTSLGDECPVCQANSVLWNTGTDADKDTVRQRKRKEHYVANIYVVKDSANPDNEGKVFLFRFGPMIFEKITDAMSPEFEDEVGFVPFDFWEGANFKLKARKQDGYVKYDKSEFDNPGPLFDDDDKLEEIWEQAYALHEIVDRKNFEDYDKLKAKLERVIGTEAEDTAPDRPARRAQAAAAAKADEIPDEPDSIVESDDDDEELAYFRSKLDED